MSIRIRPKHPEPDPKPLKRLQFDGLYTMAKKTTHANIPRNMKKKKQSMFVGDKQNDKIKWI